MFYQSLLTAQFKGKADVFCVKEIDRLLAEEQKGLKGRVSKQLFEDANTCDNAFV